MNKFRPKFFFHDIIVSIVIAFVFYFTIFGLLLTHAIDQIPFLNEILWSMSSGDIFWLAVFVGILTFAFQALSNGFKTVFAALFLFIAFFWIRDRVPSIWTSLETFWNSIAELFH